MAEILGAATTATKYFLEVNQITIDNNTFKCSIMTSEMAGGTNQRILALVRFSPSISKYHISQRKESV